MTCLVLHLGMYEITRSERKCTFTAMHFHFFVTKWTIRRTPNRLQKSITNTHQCCPHVHHLANIILYLYRYNESHLQEKPVLMKMWIYFWTMTEKIKCEQTINYTVKSCFLYCFVLACNGTSGQVHGSKTLSNVQQFSHIAASAGNEMLAF